WSRPGFEEPPRELVRCRLPRAAADHLGVPRGLAREADRLRGGGCDPELARPQEPPRGRPALLRLLPSADAARAPDLRRGRARLGDGEQRPEAAGRARALDGPE